MWLAFRALRSEFGDSDHWPTLDHAALPQQAVLAEVPEAVDTVVFPNYESMPERDDITDPFTEVSRLLGLLVTLVSTLPASLRREGALSSSQQQCDAMLRLSISRNFFFDT